MSLPQPSSDFTALGSYIFAGGFTLGVERHFNVLAHLESGMYGVKTFRLNRPYVPVHVGVDRWPTEKFRDRVDFVYCNPPCALFSSAGASIKNGKDNWRTDPRKSCIYDCFSLLEKIRPQVLAIESVTNAFTRGRELFDELAAKAHALGYSVTHLLENACWLTVPQIRRRYFFIAHKVKLEVEHPNWGPPTTVAEALESVTEPGWSRPVRPDLTRYYQELVQTNGPNNGIRALWERDNPPEKQVRSRFGVQGRPRMMEHRIPHSKPMGAFIGDFHIHPTEPRNLGLNEAKALCGFPADWRFSHDGGGFSELARGVMPGVGDWLARMVKRSLTLPKHLTNFTAEVLDLQEPPLSL